MAFTGAAVVTLVSDGLVRVTGLSLAGGAAGTISLKGGAGEIKLPEAFKPREYKNAKAGDVSLQDSLEITMVPVTSVTTLVPVQAVKTGTTPTDFLATLTNTTVATVSAELEIYIRHH